MPGNEGFKSTELTSIVPSISVSLSIMLNTTFAFEGAVFVSLTAAGASLTEFTVTEIMPGKSASDVKTGSGTPLSFIK